MKTLTFDIETYKNYTLFALRDIESKSLYTFEIRGEENTLPDKSKKKLHKLLDKNNIITFNGIKFDEPITSYALTGVTASEIFAGVQAIIVDNLPRFAFYKKANCRPIINNHIDIMDVAQGIASLKLYGARIGTSKLQDLPYSPETILTDKEMDEVRDYCENDLKLTQELYHKLENDLNLRKSISDEYGVDVMSDNGAKIAEKLLIKETKYDGKAPSIPESISYTPPKYIKFKTPQLKEFFKYIKNHKYLLNANGNVELPAKLKQELLELDGLNYQMGNGGIHGSVESTTIIPKDDETIVDIDYKSLYPSLIIQNNFIPKHIGSKFLNVYQGMYDKRNKELKPAMKKCEYGSDEYISLDNAQNTMKLVLNSSFGKLGLRYSKLYDPTALLHITLTGQLTLMMVIEKLSLKGFKTFYANTDGITLLVRKKDVKKIQKITHKFDKKTGLEMEYNYFKSSHIRDVNNFVNITTDGSVKAKGAYGEPTLNKNAQTPIVFEAVRKFLQDGTSIRKTINTCKNVHDFCSSRTVRGGAMFSDDMPELKPERWEESLARNKRITKSILKEQEGLEAEWVKDNGTYLGKVVRWYYSTKGSSIHYKTNGNKVPKSDGAIPMMDLKNKLPKDLDYAWYYAEAEQMLVDLGI